MDRSTLSQVRRLVVKVETGTLTDRSGHFDRQNCDEEGIAGSLLEVAALPDPVGEVTVRDT